MYNKKKEKNEKYIFISVIFLVLIKLVNNYDKKGNDLKCLINHLKISKYQII